LFGIGTNVPWNGPFVKAEKRQKRAGRKERQKRAAEKSG
jgi:hypothetical protein